METLLTVAIPTFNNNSQLRGALASMIRYTDFPYEILVVNNCPENAQETEELVQGLGFPRVRVVHMEENAGWMGGINKALDETDTKFFCMMNDDVLFLPGQPWFWRALTLHFEHPQVAAVGPCSNFVMGSQSLFNYNVGPVVSTSLLIGFCMILRTEELKALGGLDESLVGGDDLDLSIRIRKKGGLLIADRMAYLHHIGQQTGGRLRPDDWDSADTQETTSNQLIKKHGVKRWLDAWSCGWETAAGLAAPYDDEETDQQWIKSNLEQYQDQNAVGLNIGSGANSFSSNGIRIIDADKAKPGESGVGGRRFTEATTENVADAEALPYTDGSMDFVIASHVIEHMLDPVETLQEWKRVLKPEGKIFFALPDHGQSESMMIDCSHLHAYTADSFSSLLGAAELEVLDIKEMPWKTFVCEAQKKGTDDV